MAIKNPEKDMPLGHGLNLIVIWHVLLTINTAPRPIIIKVIVKPKID